MTAGPTEVLENGLTELGVSIPKTAATKLIDYAELVIEHNAATNLTGARSVTSFVTEQILDCLSMLTVIVPRGPLVDVGSGAGLPGIPLAIALPRLSFFLLEPRAKRAGFLELAAGRLGLGKVQVVKSSALGPGSERLAGLAGAATVRAVTEPERAFSLAAPFLRVGGSAILYRGKAGEASRREANAARRAGLGGIRIEPVSVPGLNASRHIWIAKRARSFQRAQ